MTLLRRIDAVRRLLLPSAALPPRPRLLTYIVTFACNARCAMCDSWKMARRDEMTPDQAAAVFARMPLLDAVRLTGGEPFVRDDLPELAEIACRALEPLLLVVSTNGFLTDRVVEFCARRRRDVPLRLVISLDGEQEQHDRIRGRPRSFDRALATILQLAPRRRELRLELSINQTILDEEGVDAYERLSARLRPLGVAHDAVVAYAASSTYTAGAPPITAPTRPGEFRTFGRLGPDAVRRLERLVRDSLADRPLTERAAKTYYIEGVRNRLCAGRGAPNPPCAALGPHVRLLPNGDVPVCQFNGTVVGNARATPFAEIWSGGAAAGQREWVAACPGCWAECEVLPSAVYSGELARRVFTTVADARRR